MPIKQIESVNKKDGIERNLKCVVEQAGKDTPCHWINRHDQFGYVCLDLIVTRGPDKYRFSRTYKAAPELVDEAFLTTEADKIVASIQAEGK